MNTRVEGIYEDDMRHLHDVEGMTQKELSEHYGVSRSTIWKRMKEYNIDGRSKSDALRGNTNSRKYSINEDFFKTWTEDSSWLYGWAIGDGCISDPLSLRFNIGRIDREALEKFKILLNSEHVIRDYDVVRDNGYVSHLSNVKFGSKKLVSNIKELSIYDVPKCCFNHFLRGFFEAEGCVSWSNGRIGSNITQNDYDTLDFIYWCLKDFRVTNRGAIISSKKTWRLQYGMYDTIALYHYLYDNCGNNFLKRKKEKFEELMQR